MSDDHSASDVWTIQITPAFDRITSFQGQAFSTGIASFEWAAATVGRVGRITGSGMASSFEAAKAEAELFADYSYSYIYDPEENDR